MNNVFFNIQAIFLQEKKNVYILSMNNMKRAKLLRNTYRIKYTVVHFATLWVHKSFVSRSQTRIWKILDIQLFPEIKSRQRHNGYQSYLIIACWHIVVYIVSFLWWNIINLSKTFPSDKVFSAISYIWI